MHATCAVTRIPFAWIEQTRPGGIIVVPWQPSQGDGHMTRLTVLDGAAYGSFHGPCGYMMLRGQRAEVCWSPHQHEDAETSTTSLDP